ncbi:hypothetical protein KPB2_5486 [Klebsiella pneumoniae Kb677]|nr:hypothetical protein KPB2_5486 [Klebsiella pneumoniae Kb677]
MVLPTPARGTARMEKFRPRSVSTIKVNGFLLTVARMAPPLSVCSWLVSPPSRLLIAVIRSPGTVKRFGSVLLTAILACPPFVRGTTVGASVPLRVADMAGTINNRQPEINNGLIFFIIYFSETRQPADAVDTTELNDITFNFAVGFRITNPCFQLPPDINAVLRRPGADRRHIKGGVNIIFFYSFRIFSQLDLKTVLRGG